MTIAPIPSVGATVTLAKAISEADVALFTLVTNDQPPPPLSEEPLPAAPTAHTIVPGAFVAAFLTAAAARHLGGLAAAHLVRAEVTSTAPAYTDDTLSASAQVAAYDPATQTLRIAVTCANQDDVRLAEGTVELRPSA